MGNQFQPSKEIRTKIVDSGLNLVQLGVYLEKNYDVTIIGQTHGSQSLQDKLASLFNSINAGVLLEESSPDMQPHYDKKDPDAIGNNFGTDDKIITDAFKRNIPVRAADLDHDKSAASAYMFPKIARTQHGYKSEFFQAVKMAESYLIKNGVDTSHFKFEKKDATPKEQAEQFIRTYEKDLPKFHKNNVMDCASNYQRNQTGGLKAFLGNALDFIPEHIHMHIKGNQRIEESNPIIAHNVEQELRKQRTTNPKAHAVLDVGQLHSDGVEKLLEDKGFNAANVKFKITDDPELDGRVFFNADSKRKEGAEIIVAVYDPASKDKVNFGRSYDIEKPRNPTECQQNLQKQKSEQLKR